MTNMDIRFRARVAGVPLWKIAEKMGISEPTIMRRLRKELSPEEKQKYFDAIQTILVEIAKQTPDENN